MIRESSFNMARGGGGEDIEGGSENFLTPERGAPKICILENQQERGGS